VTTLTILSANLKNPYFSSWRVDRAALLARLEAFARLAEGAAADVLLCQEVGRGRDFRVDEWLAARLGLIALYARANGGGRFGREEGLAILSRYPLRNPRQTLLAGGLWRRPALGAVVETPLGELAVYSAHLSLRPWRNRRGVARLRAWVEQTAGTRPALIGGDFNANETTSHIVALGAARGGEPGWVDAFRAFQPTADGTTLTRQLLGRTVARQRLDYLFLRPGGMPIRIVNSAVVTSTGAPFSDHRAVVARFAAGSMNQLKQGAT
jgi:endonuclease/exonuclease/phosphatase family metal-dependent hydrolase